MCDKCDGVQGAVGYIPQIKGTEGIPTTETNGLGEDK